jgi:hypothetical protein
MNRLFQALRYRGPEDFRAPKQEGQPSRPHEKRPVCRADRGAIPGFALLETVRVVPKKHAPLAAKRLADIEWPPPHSVNASPLHGALRPAMGRGRVSRAGR